MKLHAIIRLSHLVACPMVFNLLCHLSWQAGMLKLTKMLNFKCFYTFGLFSPSFWAGHKGAHVKIAQNHKSVTFS